MTLPPHVQTLLEHAGVIDRDRVTARPTTRRCPTCRQLLTVALADDGPGVPGIRATTTAARLSLLGEVQALLAGRLTFTVRAGSMTWRDVITINALPANIASVHAEHRCGEHFDSLPQPSIHARPISDPTTIPF